MPEFPPPLPAQPPELPAFGTPSPAARKSGWPVWKILLLIGGVVLTGVAAIAAMTFFYMKTAKDYEPSAEQKSAVLTAKHVAEWFEIEVSKGEEIWTAQQFMDGSKQIFYYYISPDLTLDCTITMELKASDTQTSYFTGWQGMKLGNRMSEEKITLEKADHLFSWGDQSQFAFQVQNGTRYGMAFITRSGNQIYFVDVWGVTLETKEEIDEFLRPKLEIFETTEF